MNKLLDNKVRDEVLNLIKPSNSEVDLINGIIRRFITRLRRSAKRLKYSCEFFVGGSFGKGTFLKNSSDIDLFVRFDKKYNNELLSSYLEDILKEANLNFKKQKGSRNYYSVKIVSKGIKVFFELVPIRKIDSYEEGLNSTDLSPFHVNFLKEKSKDNPNLMDEIRITKQFLKSKGLYGAESYINGFSGHSIDILISYYGSFENFIRAGSKWKEREFIDINNFYSDYDEAINSLGEDKLSNLILIDPIIRTRNASRALSNEKYCEFILLCNKLEKSSSLKIEDFKSNKLDYNLVIEEARKYAKENNLKFLSYKIKFSINNESEDIVGSKLLKLEKKFKKFFTSLDFKVFIDDFYIDINSGISLFIFLFEKSNLPKIKKVMGPKVFMRKAVENFLENRDYYFIEDSRVCVYEPRISYKLNEVSKIDIEHSRKMLNKDISFIKSIRRII